MRTLHRSSEPLRVMQLLPHLGVGGAEQMAGHLMIGLASSHSVTAVSLGKPFGSTLEQKIREAGIPIVFLNKRKGPDPRMLLHLYRVLKKLQPDIVHTHLSVLRYLLPLLPLCRVPVVVHTLHNLAERETDAVGLRVQKFAFRKAVQAVAICDEVAGSFQRVYGMPCRAIIPNGVVVGAAPGAPELRAIWRAKEGLDSGDVMFISVSRMEPQKNPFLLLKAFADLPDPRSHLVMAGVGSLREAVSAWVRENRLERRVHVLGTRNDVAACLAAADVFVLSSDWEGHPLAVMEAMDAGLPIAATAVGGVPELVESGVHGVLVPPGDAASLTKAMQSLAEDGELRSSMGAAARSRALAAFGVDRMVRSYADFYAAAMAAVMEPQRAGRGPRYAGATARCACGPGSISRDVTEEGRRVDACADYSSPKQEIVHE